MHRPNLERHASPRQSDVTRERPLTNKDVIDWGSSWAVVVSDPNESGRVSIQLKTGRYVHSVPLAEQQRSHQG